MNTLALRPHDALGRPMPCGMQSYHVGSARTHSTRAPAAAARSWRFITPRELPARRQTIAVRLARTVCSQTIHGSQARTRQGATLAGCSRCTLRSIQPEATAASGARRAAHSQIGWRSARRSDALRHLGSCPFRPCRVQVVSRSGHVTSKSCHVQVTCHVTFRSYSVQVTSSSGHVTLRACQVQGMSGHVTCRPCQGMSRSGHVTFKSRHHHVTFRSCHGSGHACNAQVM